ncbi:MAG: hypothetical protein A3F14_04790 [Gammaproteobacteria bacterium RIFCSPHIGHO2_12_FULL_43_28]|nr:MAG: hypothetical protein A3F14_04790 [Gammaproteobacteria bacterium RIFCSPHIGHO2_12_FULL_43_28]
MKRMFFLSVFAFFLTSTAMANAEPPIAAGERALNHTLWLTANTSPILPQTAPKPPGLLQQQNIAPSPATKEMHRPNNAYKRKAAAQQHLHQKALRNHQQLQRKHLRLRQQTS